MDLQEVEKIAQRGPNDQVSPNGRVNTVQYQNQECVCRVLFHFITHVHSYYRHHNQDTEQSHQHKYLWVHHFKLECCREALPFFKFLYVFLPSNSVILFGLPY